MTDVDLLHPCSYGSDVARRTTSPPFVPLRDEGKLFLIREAAESAPSIALDAEGSYLCFSLAGEMRIETDRDERALATRKLNIVRPADSGGNWRLHFRSPTILAAVLFISARWCRSCPQGPHCKVARFLLTGKGGLASECDQALEFDDHGLAVARSLLDARIEEDADALSVEQSVLALLSWAFAKDSVALDDRTPKTSLHPQAALKIRQVAELLRQRIDAPPTIAQLSALVGLNESDLKRCFKCLYGVSIASYSRRRRLDTACDLLAHSPLGVAAIALEVGFTNPSQFARAFRRQYGVNPSDYRRSPT